MNLKQSFIELPTPSVKLKVISSYFDEPNNPDNLGYVRCRTCCERFDPYVEYEFKINHLKSHKDIWLRFQKNLEDSLKNKYFHKNVIYDDEREADDLVLSTGITWNKESIVIRLPKSRTKRIRYQSDRWKDGENSWNRKVADEYQNNHIGAYQGNFDKPICDTDLRCGNWGVTFADFVNYRHEPVEACKIFDINTTKYRNLKNKDKIKAYYIKDRSHGEKIAGPAQIIEDHRIIYTCTKSCCIFPCLCKGCVLAEVECSEHTILHPHFFNPDEDFFTVRNGDTLNITGNTGNITFSNSMQKGYEMIYDVYRYAGIERICLICTDDNFQHQAFHFVYHSHCKFCRASRHRIEGVLTHDHFLIRFENRRYEELLSCHFCFKIFSSVQYKKMHVKNSHGENKSPSSSEIGNTSCNTRKDPNHKHHETEKTMKCEHCENKFCLKHSLDVHVKSVHNYETVQCTICKQNFNRQSNLNSHYKYVHDILKNILDMDERTEIEYHECDQCQFKSRDIRKLTRHTLSLHSDLKSFNCTECDFSCKRMDNLNRHIRNLHRKESTAIHSCTFCEFSSLYLPNLERHMSRMHNDE